MQSLSTDEQAFPKTLWSSAKDDWGTPQAVFTRLDAEFDFQLDAAACEWNAKCLCYYDRSDDSLQRPWHPFGSVFLNPPYGRNSAVWYAKARAESRKGCTVVIVCPARTDTRWFHEHVAGQAEVRFVRGRLKFERLKGANLVAGDAATFPSMVVVMRPDDPKPSTAIVPAHGWAQNSGDHLMTKTPPKTSTPTRLRANVKVPIDTPLTQLNMYIGDNRSGKTSVVGDAIHLAATGKHAIGPHPKNLAELAPPDAGELYAELTNGADAGAHSFRMPVLPKPKKPTHTAPAAVSAMPVAQASEILSWDHAKAREALFARWGKVNAIPTPAGLNESQLAAWEDAVDEVAAANPSADPAQCLSLLAKHFRSLKLRKGKQVKAAEAEIENLRGIAGEAAGVEMLVTLEAQLASATAHAESTSAREQLAERQAEVEEHRVAAEAARTRLQAARDTAVVQEQQSAEEQARVAQADVGAEELRNSARDVRASIAGVIDRRTRARAVVEVIERAAAALETTPSIQCPCCLSTVTREEAAESRRLANARNTLLRQIEEWSTSISGTLAEAKATEDRADSLQDSAALLAEAALSTLRQHQADIVAAQGAVELAELQLRSAQEAAKMLETVIGEAAAYEGPTPGEVQVRIDDLRAAENNRQQISRKRTEALQVSNERNLAKLLEQESTQLLRNLVRGVVDDAEAAVNQYMPQGMHATLQLDTTLCAWTVEGNDGRAHRLAALAGSERGALVVAVGLAWTEGSPLRLITLDDESLPKMSPQNLRAVLDALEAATLRDPSIQVHAAWPAIRLDHKDEIPAAWNQITVGADRARS